MDDDEDYGFMLNTSLISVANISEHLEEEKEEPLEEEFQPPQ